MLFQFPRLYETQIYATSLLLNISRPEPNKCVGRGMAHVLRLLASSSDQHLLGSVLFFFVLCTLGCQFPWIIHIDYPSVFSNVYMCRRPKVLLAVARNIEKLQLAENNSFDWAYFIFNFLSK